VIHLYRVLEPGQIRGLPLLSSSLDTAAYKRDYERDVREAARQAANFGVLLEKGAPGMGIRSLNTITDLEPGTMRTLPDGYRPTMVKPEQPSTQYVDFIREMDRRLGRPVGMPVMMVQLDSRDHSWSSARFDSSLYWRQVVDFRRLLEWPLTRMARAKVLEFGLGTGRGAMPFKVFWMWPAIPYVDPSKEVQASVTRLENFLSTFHDELRAGGVDFDEHMAEIQSELETLRGLGLDWPGQGPPGMRGEDVEGKVEGLVEEAMGPGKGNGKRKSRALCAELLSGALLKGQ
jgi:capsid protein